MDNKKVLSQLVKIASNQQKILNKLAQVTDAGSGVENLLSEFVKYYFINWMIPHEVVAKQSRTISRTGDKSLQADITLTLDDKSQKSIAEDPVNGLAAYLNNKLAVANKDPNSKWKALQGFTVTFNVVAN